MIYFIVYLYERELTLNELEKIQKILKENHGIVTASGVTAEGIPRRSLSDMVEIGLLHKISRGVYISHEAWEDEMYFLQYRYARGIFSHETALFLQGYSDRTPDSYTMMFPAGYNVKTIRKEEMIVRHTDMKYYGLGITEVVSMFGNTLKAYDLERTLCDIVQRKSRCDISIVTQAMKAYASSGDKNIFKLMSYAKIFRVESRIRNFMEALL